MSRTTRITGLAVLMLSLFGCGSPERPIHTVDRVDLERFMGEWYVVASIPIFLEADAYNAVESYALNDDGSISTTYRFYEGSFEGEEKVYRPIGYVREEVPGNAVWDMQFLWPFRSEYRIIYLDEDYSRTIIGRSARDYVWVMARQPQIPESDLQQLLDFIREQGYGLTDLRRVPQQPVSERQ